MMRPFSLALTLAALMSLAACDGGGDPQSEGQIPGEVPLDTPVAEASPAEVELPEDFLSRDCTTVASAYSEALKSKDFLVASQAWAEDVGLEELALRYKGYGAPALKIGQARVEGAAGSLFCELTVTLRDDDDPQLPLRQGTLTLRRANDVPGASPEQLRWRITESTIRERVRHPSEPPPI